jgi:aspartate kinase
MAPERQAPDVAGRRPDAVRVIKFGGTSVTGGDRIDTIGAVVRDRLSSCRPIVVVSAFANVTTLLERAAYAARDGEDPEAFDRLRTIHEQAARDMAASAIEVQATVATLLEECESHLVQIASSGVCSPRTLDEVLSYGERLSSAIITASLVDRGIDAVRVDAADVVVTDANYGDARADLSATRGRVGQALPDFPSVPIVTGFLGATMEGVRTTLGREGSDYSAAVLAWATGAREVEIWTDVDGVMTADPRVVTGARPLRHLSYTELFELSSWGAKVVHPKTVRPLEERSIDLFIRNTTSPTDPGTRVGPVGRDERKGGPLGVTHLDVDALLAPGRGEPSAAESRRELTGLLEELRRIEGPTSAVTVVGSLEAAGVPDGATLVEIVRSEGIAVHGISASPSGRAVSIGVSAHDADAAVRALHRALFSFVPSDALHA